MEEEAQPGLSKRSVLVAAAVVALFIVSVVVAGVIAFVRWTGSPYAAGRVVREVLRGERGAEEAVTEIIIDRMAREANVPPDEVAALKRELGPISRDLPALSEGEKHKLAMLIRKSVEDGRLEEEEVAAIRDYSYFSARDGNAKP